jgi:hypothetical protein
MIMSRNPPRASETWSQVRGVAVRLEPLSSEVSSPEA